MMFNMRTFIIIFLSSLLFTALVIGGSLGLSGNDIPGLPNDDSYQGIYLHDMVHRSIKEGNLAFWDTMQFFPHGYHVPSTNGGNYIEMLASGVLKYFFPNANWYGIAHFFWIPVNIICFIPLGRYLWGSRMLAFSVACTWTTLPYTLSFISYGRLTQTVQFAIPLCLLYFLRFQEEDNKKAPYLLGISLALAAWSYWYFAIFILLLSPVFLIPNCKNIGFQTSMKRISLTIGTMGICIAPLLFIVYYPLFIGVPLPSPPVSIHSISPIFPDAIHLFPMKETTNLLWTLFPLSVWVLAIIGFIIGKRKKTWGLLALISVIFSMGPAILYNDLVWFLPYFPFWKIVPLLDRLLHPDRWMLVGGIFICILSGEGLLGLTQKLTNRRWGQLFVYSTLLLPLLSLVESNRRGILPLSTWEQKVPTIWKEAQKTSGAIIVVPIMRSQRVTQYQPFHNRPLLGGMVENQPWTYSPDFQKMIESNGLLMDLFSKNDGNSKKFYVYQDDIDELQELGFTQIVFSQDDWNHLNHPKTQKMDMIKLLSDALGSPLQTTINGDAIWNIPQKGRPGRSSAAGGSIQNIGPPDPIPDGAPPI